MTSFQRSIHSSYSLVFIKTFRNTLRLFENPICPTAVEIPCRLLTLVVNSSCLTIFVEILCDCRSYPIDSTCMRILAIISRFLEFVLLAQTSFRTWAGSRSIKPWLIVHLSLFNLLLWSELLLLSSTILENRYSSVSLYFELFRCFHNLMCLHSFFFWLSTDTHIRSFADRQILWWIIIRQFPSYSKPLGSSTDTKCLCELYLLLLPSILLLRACILYFCCLLYRFLKMSSDGLNLCFLQSMWTQKFSQVILFWCFHQVNFQR